MEHPALRLRRVSKNFAGVPALRNVDVDVAQGEIRALVGQNGSGKSTLIKILAGFHTPEPGASANLAGEPFRLGHPAAAEDAGLRFVHQDLALVSELDTTENLALGGGFPRRNFGLVDWRQARSDAKMRLSRLGYEFDISSPVAELTAAQRTAIAVARALDERVSAPKMLVLDEPTANLPVAEVIRLMDLVRSVRDRGVSVLFVSHHLHEVFGLCDSVTVLRDGAYVDTRPTEGLTEPELVTLMVGRELAAAQEHHRGDADSAGNEVVLEAKNLSTRLIRSASLTVSAGEVVGVAGLTGSGREHLGPAIFGGITRGGTVSLQGRTLPTGRPDLAMAGGVGFVPAERHANALFPEQTLRENISVAEPRAHTKGPFVDRRRERSDVQRWLERLDVRPPSPEAEIQSLSGGNQQKVVLARWLRRRPKVLVLDEPTQGVDVGAKAEIHQLVAEAARTGTAVLVISTDHQELARLCDRVLVLYAGEIVATPAAPALDADLLTSLTLSPKADQLGRQPA
jgi:ribose transport system ATP-binding protein